MNEGGHREHEHAGMSSRGILNAKKVIGRIGLKEGDTFLDIGCGEGHFSKAASVAVGRKGRVYALDVDERALASFKSNIEQRGIQNIEISKADATRGIPVEDGTVDVCFMANVLHGFTANNEVEGVFGELVRVLRPKGRLAVVEFKKILSPGPPVSVRLSPEDVEKVAAPFGFRVEEVRKAGLFHYLVLLRKR